MQKMLLGIVVLGMGLSAACSPGNPVNGKIATPLVRAGTTFEGGSGSALTPGLILERAARAFSHVRSFRVRETLEPAAGSQATYDIEVLAPDKEHWLSEGECANNLRGETIWIGSTGYYRCGAQAWVEAEQRDKTVRASYADYLEQSVGYAISRGDSTREWQVAADYRGANAPAGTMIWSIRQKDFLPYKLTFTNEGGYALTSEFRDFDSPAITIRAP